MPLSKSAGRDPLGARSSGHGGHHLHAYEIANTVTFLCSEAASYTTGASYVVDGGMLLMGPHAGSDLPPDEWRED